MVIIIWHQGAFNVLVFSIFNILDDHPQKNVAIFGYKVDMELQIVKMFI
jgi:hypothetical protein